MNALPVHYALGYAERGWVVMPLQPGDNRPHGDILGTGWTFDDVGSRDPRVIEQWWSWDPAANIGVVCGARSRILVLDVDVKRMDGEGSLSEWRNAGNVLPETVTVRTPSGGRHLWFSLPDGEDVRRKTGWLPGVDACGSGGFVAVPPSCKTVPVRSPKPWEPATIEYREYEWHSGKNDTWTMEWAPRFLLEDIRTRKPTVVDRQGRTRSVGGNLPSTEEFLERGFGFFTGSRNTDCYRLSWRLWQRRLDEQEVVAVCLAVYKRTPQTNHPFSWGECYQTIRSARDHWRATREAERELALETLKAWTGE